jgi:hypothetical protein
MRLSQRHRRQPGVGAGTRRGEPDEQTPACAARMRAGTRRNPSGSVVSRDVVLLPHFPSSHLIFPPAGSVCPACGVRRASSARASFASSCTNAASALPSVRRPPSMCRTHPARESLVATSPARAVTAPRRRRPRRRGESSSAASTATGMPNGDCSTRSSTSIHDHPFPGAVRQRSGTAGRTAPCRRGSWPSCPRPAILTANGERSPCACKNVACGRSAVAVQRCPARAADGDLAHAGRLVAAPPACLRGAPDRMPLRR